jgi:hypothetical protein
VSRKTLLGLLAFMGAVSVTAGVALIYPPAGFVVGGAFALLLGLFAEDGDG